VSVLEIIRPDLESLVDQVVRIARDKVADIPTRSERVWKIVRDGRERRPTLERETQKDYDVFLAEDPARLENLPPFLSIQKKVDLNQSLRTAFLIAEGAPARPDDVALRYLLPVMNEILTRIDSGQSQDEAAKSVLDRLDEYLSSDTCNARVIAPLLNFTSEKANFEIRDGVHLREFTDHDLQDHCGAVHLSPDFTYLYKLSSIRFHLEAAFKQQRQVGFDTSKGGQYQARLESTLSAMRLLRSGAVGFGFMKYEVEELFGKRMSWTMGYGGQGNYFGDSYDLREEGLDPLRDILANLEHVAKDSRFAIGMSRLMGAYLKPFGGDRLVDYWIALESLMIPDGTTELVYRVSLRTARLVADAHNRRPAYKFLKASYGERSQFVHGSKTSVDGGTVSATEDYLRKVLVHCVKNRKVPCAEELDSLVLGTGEGQEHTES
jgi:hypothetical protein